MKNAPSGPFPAARLPFDWISVGPWVRYGMALSYFLGLIAWELSDSYWSDPAASLLSLLTVAYLALIVSSYVRRGPDVPLRRGDWLAQVVALLGANLLVPLSLLPVQSSGAEMFAVIMGVLGLAFSFWAVWHLGPAFSIVPEARRLVQSGPYRWVRHPLYLAGFLIGLGLLGASFSPSSLGLFLGFVGCQGLRMEYEERVLSEGLLEYPQYRQRTWALLPHIF